jgi:mannosyl-oligosaccharide alpha-1,2-mannosidase
MLVSTLDAPIAFDDGNLIYIKEISVDDRQNSEQNQLHYDPGNTQKYQHLPLNVSFLNERNKLLNKQTELQKDQNREIPVATPIPAPSPTPSSILAPRPVEGTKLQEAITTSENLFDVHSLVVRDDIIVRPDPNESEENIRRREAIKQMFLHAYSGYEEKCFGHDELRPTSGGCSDWLGMGVTIIDSLDTMLIMGLGDHFLRGKKWLQEAFNVNKDRSVSVFETTIRIVGGLLSAYDFTEDPLFLEKAEEVVKKLLPAFKTPSGIPKASVNLQSGMSGLPLWTGGLAILAEIGTLQMEFSYLSHHTNNSHYAELALKVIETLRKRQPPNGLYPIFVNINDGSPSGGVVSLGALGDSFYEYLLKVWLLFRKSKPLFKEMYDEAIEAIHRLMIDKVPERGWIFPAELHNNKKYRKVDHLACFSGGMFALGAVNSNDPVVKTRDLETAEGIATFCMEMYRRTASKLSPEYVEVDLDKQEFKLPPGDARAYIMRPETVETLFVMYRLTGDQKYRDWGWEIAQAIEKNCKTKFGYAGLRDVSQSSPVKDDTQQSFFLAETLKYLYLLFSPPQYIPLEKYVFNTEAHPLSTFKPNVFK